MSDFSGDVGVLNSTLGSAEEALTPPIDEGIRAEIKALGYHPFIMVRLRDAASTRYLSCRTHDELGPFVSELLRIPALGDDTLLRGLERALQGEPYEAASALFAWVENAEPEITERVYLRAPGDCDPYCYPVFERTADGRQATPEQRVQVLLDLFEAYDTTDGNNATRYLFMETLAFALSRCLGARGRFTQALSLVERAMVESSSSIHLKAAKHALNYKINGQPLPRRLEKFVGADNGYLKQFVCAAPFQRLDICHNGDVLVCCGHWLPTVVGNFIASPIDDVLNSDTALKIRESVTDGSYKYCNHIDCMPLSQQLLPRRDEQVDPSVVKAIDTGRYEVDGADILTFGLDMTCNLSCPSCRKERIVEKVSQATEKTRAIEEKLYPLLPSVKRLHINPAGELFASKPARRLLELIDDERCPNLILNIISNGTLFDETEWNRYPGIHGKVWTVRISTDAATKPTFEKLRRLGNYDVFLENARFLGSLRRSGRIGMLRFSFTYQVDNFREMIDFVEFVKSVGGDYALFERLHNNYRTFSDADFRQKEVHRRDHPLHADFIRIVNDPVFRDTKSVLHDFEFPGREKTVEEVSGARQRDVELRQRLEAFCNERKVAVPSDHYRQLDELSAFGVNS